MTWIDDFVHTLEQMPTPKAGPAQAAPNKWKWLEKIDQLPALVAAALKEYGTTEVPGSRNNSRIIGWAKEVAKCDSTPYSRWAADWYTHDSVPWCGLFMATMACRTMGNKPDRAPVNSYLSALAWAAWAEPVDFRNTNNIWCGDVAVFTRSGGGHVSIIVGVSQDGKNVICIGGNQSDAVNISSFPISRLYAVRRPKYRVRPAGAKNIRISTSGVPISTNEA